MQKRQVTLANMCLIMSLRAITHGLETNLCSSSYLTWAAAELERLASEANRLADETDPAPDLEGKLPGFD